ncbi:GtrA family protein [Pseudolysinimonas sp.]|uniref:GtrA family protein n=1 Tax=Pseudolysinimonas sp. TaxID=2680009 RepID=UPI003F81B35C
MRTLLGQFARFGVVGGVGFLVNFGIFNLLLFTVFDSKKIHEGPLLANVIATIVAIAVNWVGNRYWTFREHRGQQLLREGVEFGVVSLGGLLIGLGCLWISHYALGFDSKLADNISSNVVGLALGTAFRFALYRLWVFRPHRGEPAPAVFPAAGESVAAPAIPAVEPTSPSRPSGSPS